MFTTKSSTLCPTNTVIVAFGIILLCFIWIGLYSKVHSERQIEIDNAIKVTDNLARAFEEHTLRTIKSADQAVLFLKYQYEQEGRAMDIPRYVREGRFVNQPFVQLGMIDEKGDLAATSQVPFVAAVLKDREHFLAHKDIDNGQLFIGKPVLGRASGKWSIQMTRRANKSDGTFAGVAVVSVDPLYFNDFYKQIDLGKNSSIALVGRDGIVRARQSAQNADIGRDVSNSVLMEQLLVSNTGDYTSKSPVDGIIRIYSYRALADYPLVVMVGIDKEEVLQNMGQRVRTYCMVALLATVVIFFFIIILLHITGQQKRTEVALKKAHDDMENKVQLRTSELFAANQELSAMNEDFQKANQDLEEEIMERQLAEQSLQETQAILQAALDNCQAGIAIADASEARVRYLNKAGMLVCNKYEEDLVKDIDINRYFDSWTLIKENGVAYERNERPLVRAVLYGETSSNEVIIRREQFKDYTVLANAAPIRDLTGKITAGIVIFLDISERKNIEKSLIKAKEEAERANVAKSNFLANMSHEIRTPMNGIIGMTDITLMTNLQDDQREYLNIVKSSTMLLLRVLNDILDYSKIEAGKIDLEEAMFDIREITNEVVDLFNIAAKQKGLHIKLNISKEIPHRIIGDSVRLRQVLSNLVGNGVKFTSHGGIVIGIDSEKRYKNKVVLKFVVADTGIGIPDDKLDKLFKRFSQINDSYTKQFGGTGLGLAISQKLIELMDGEIGVESKEGVGSRFFFTAVFGLQEGGILAIDSPQKATTQHKNTEYKKILLAEDDLISRNLATLILEKNGFEVIAVENGKQAVDAFEQEKFELILMDINMPHLNGYTATATIRDQEKQIKFHTPIIAMTAYALKGDRERCLAAGMDDYISKPIELDKFIELINKWLTK